MCKTKTYYDVEGNERTLDQMVKHEPAWAANRIRAGEKAIERLNKEAKEITDLKEQIEHLESKNKLLREIIKHPKED